MNNFKDYLNFSSNLADNLYRMRLIALHEAKKKKIHKKEDKKAKKDYDGDGKVESGSEEYLGSRKKAIEKAIAEKKGKKVLESVQNGGVVNKFNDSDDGHQSSDEQVATTPDGIEDLEAQLIGMKDEFAQAQADLSKPGSSFKETMAGRDMLSKILAMQTKISEHPATKAKIEAARQEQANTPGFFSQRGADQDPFYRIDTPEERGLNMGERQLPLTDYDKAKSGRKER